MQKKVYLIPLTKEEEQFYSGGSIGKYIGWGAVIGYIADNWADIKTAIRDFVKEH